jgi:transposase-like protein
VTEPKENLPDLNADLFETPRETLTEENIKEYTDYGGIICPYCGSQDITGQDVEIDEGVASQEVDCSNCDKTWTDQYDLVGIREHE